MMSDGYLVEMALRARAHPTIAEVEKSLRAELMRERTALEFKAMVGQIGLLTHRGGRRIITVDPFRASLPVIVHELLHATRYDQLAAFGQLEEVVTHALEDAVERYINRSERRSATWRALVDAKTPEGDGS